MKLLLAIAVLAGVSAAFSDDPIGAHLGEPEMQFESYQLVLLRRGPKWTPEETPALEQLQQAHLAHLGKMGESGKMVIAGPFGDQHDQSLRGMCLYRVGSLEQAKNLAKEDPMVKAGRLKVEVLTWYVEKGYMTFPKAPPVP